MQTYSEIEHGADVSFRVQGRNFRELVENAARSMLCLQGRTPTAATVRRNACVSGEDRETLLVNCLNEILYLQEVHEECYYECHIKVLSANSLQAELIGERSSRPCKLIKAVTFHNLEIETVAGALQATVVMDV